MKQVEKKLSGNRAMTARGLLPVTIYLEPKDAEKLMKIAERERRKRANVVLGFVLDGLKKVDKK